MTIAATFKPARVFVGEPVTLHLCVRNEKWMPLFVLRLGIWLPHGLQGDEARAAAAIRGFRRRLFVPGRSEVTLDLPVTVGPRGEFWLERIEAEVADPFELAPLRRTWPDEAALMVMPEPRVMIPIEIRRRLPFGAPAHASRMFEERERFAGVRPYEPGDPLNRIHWRLTAHSGGLMTKLFEPTRSAAVWLFVDLAAGEPYWDNVFPEVAEDGIGWASFLARRALEAGWRVGLAANTHLRHGRGVLWVPASSARGHEAALFAALSRMPSEPTSDLAPVLRERGKTLGRDATAVVLSSRMGEALRQEVTDLRARGTAVVTLSPLAASLGETG